MQLVGFVSSNKDLIKCCSFFNLFRDLFTRKTILIKLIELKFEEHKVSKCVLTTYDYIERFI